MTKIGIISDTHVPERLPTLPYDEIAAAFAGCELILHAGDIEAQSVLDKLATIAPVLAVRGDDEQDTRDLPEKRIIEIAGKQIGLHHGHRPLWREMPSRIRNLFSKQMDWAGIQADLLAYFAEDNVDVIVFGHFHLPYNTIHNEILLFNAGSIFKPSWDGIQWRKQHSQSKLRRMTLAVEQYLVPRQPKNPPAPTIGLLHIENGHIWGEHLPVSFPNFE